MATQSQARTVGEIETLHPVASGCGKRPAYHLSFHDPSTKVEMAAVRKGFTGRFERPGQMTVSPPLLRAGELHLVADEERERHRELRGANERGRNKHYMRKRLAEGARH